MDENVATSPSTAGFPSNLPLHGRVGWGGGGTPVLSTREVQTHRQQGWNDGHKSEHLSLGLRWTEAGLSALTDHPGWRVLTAGKRGGLSLGGGQNDIKE